MANDSLASKQISPADLKTVLEALKLIDTILKPNLIALTPDERRKKAKMGDKTMPFVEKVTEYVISNPEFAPSFMDVETFLANFKNVSELTQIFRPMEQLVSMMNDTILNNGSESYVSSLQYYASTKEGNKGNAAGAKPIFEDLKKRFENSKPKKKD